MDLTIDPKILRNEDLVGHREYAKSVTEEYLDRANRYTETLTYRDGVLVIGTVAPGAYRRRRQSALAKATKYKARLVKKFEIAFKFLVAADEELVRRSA